MMASSIAEQLAFRLSWYKGFATRRAAPGSFAAWIGQAIGHYSPDQGAGFITATIGALVVLFIWNRLVAKGMISDPGGK